jgi:hypothetical protein
MAVNTCEVDGLVSQITQYNTGAVEEPAAAMGRFRIEAGKEVGAAAGTGGPDRI